MYLLVGRGTAIEPEGDSVELVQRNSGAALQVESVPSSHLLFCKHRNKER